MAKRDVREYYGQLVVSELQLQEDLKDFQDAFSAGLITEDKLASVKEELAEMERNKTRVAWILYLLDLPNRKAKKTKAMKHDAEVIHSFDKLDASTKAVLDEQNCVRAHVKEMLADIINKQKDEEK